MANTNQQCTEGLVATQGLMQIIGVRSTLIPNQRGLRLRGAERFLVLQYEEAPLSLSPL